MLLLQRLNDRSKSVANRLLSDLGLARAGRDIGRVFPDARGKSNSDALIILMSIAVNEMMDIPEGKRKDATAGAAKTSWGDGIRKTGCYRRRGSAEDSDGNQSEERVGAGAESGARRDITNGTQQKDRDREREEARTFGINRRDHQIGKGEKGGCYLWIFRGGKKELLRLVLAGHPAEG